MSKLTNFFGASQKQIEQDPMNQVAFGIWTRGYNNQSTLGLYNHNLQCLGVERFPGSIGGDGNAANSTNFINYAAGDFAGSANTVSALVTTGVQYPEQGGGSGAVMNGPLGHSQFQVPIKATGGDPILGSFPYREGFKNACVGSTFGLDQHYNLFTRWWGRMYGASSNTTNGAGFYIRPNVPASALMAYKDSANGDIAGSNVNVYGDMDYMANLGTANRVDLIASGFVTAGYNVAVGGICYNQRSKTLCILEKGATADNNTANRWRPVICKNAPDPSLYIEKEREYQVLLTTALAVSGNRVVGANCSPDGYETAEAGYFARPILCDDNTIYYMQEASNTNPHVQTLHKWAFNSSTNAFVAPVVHAKADSWSVPQYADWDATWMAKVEYQQSLDGELVCVYDCPNHYHGALRMVLINLKTGKTTKMHTAQDTANSWGVCAYGARNFLIKKNANSDGTGQYIFKLNWESYDRYFGGGGDYSGDENVLITAWPTHDVMDNAGSKATDYTAIWRNVRYDNRAIVLASKNTYNTYDAQ
jgi:hypothetical protein